MGMIVALMTISATFASAQSELTALSNLYVTITMPSDTSMEVESVQYLADSSAVPERVQLNVQLDVSTPSELDHLVLAYGTTAGGSDVLGMELEAVEIGSAYYLHFSGFLFPIIDGRVSIRRLIPASTLGGPCYLMIQGFDSASMQTNQLTRSNIQ